MLRYMLDTTLCIRVLRDRPKGLRDRFNLEADGLAISTVVLTELLHGAAKSAQPEHNRRAVERFASRLEVLSFVEIGRATCREQVWQDEWHMVGSESLHET